MSILGNKARELIKDAGMRFPDRPWRKEQPQKYENGRRVPRFQGDAIESEGGGRCPKCGGSARIAWVWITRRYGGEDGPIYDRWPVQKEVTCKECGQFRVRLEDEEIDQKYQRKG